MDLKQAYVEMPHNTIMKIRENYKEVSEEKINSYFLINKYFVVKYNTYKESNKFGLRVDEDNQIPLSDYVNDNKLIDIKFIIVDTILNTIYYDGSKKEVKKVLELFFNISNPKLTGEVAIEYLEYLTSIKIVDVIYGQTSLDQTEAFKVERNILELTSSEKVKECSVEYKFFAQSGFRVNSLKKLIEKNRSGTKRIFLNGIDKDGNSLSSDSDGVLNKKITLDLELQTFEEKRDISFIKLIDELNKSLKGK
ncbi:hypothetical protein [Anaerorhabdus furcosa]|uniref:Uncharacterized protein n=1 Tax=Anaerorhabdus furcosa TaxID=118967 RepID=A0A1T4M101_9FIRM|nr:hypothetical protein [Anaerorhabdus furcosa]SJZ60394.1 hypothetical protein SAMN02745191_1129 [Anaerorhabdus furcosa]